MPVTAWIASGVAIVGTIALIGALWFDSLFEAPTAVHHQSLTQHLGSRSVLAIFAHPDDETLAAGVLADAGSREGIEVRTITLTRGENGYEAPSVSRKEDLPLIRESELRRYGFALGIDHQEVWEYPDGGLRNVSGLALTGRLV
jgi:LmbE family N-acetylglucosaminyl deacetylase